MELIKDITQPVRVKKNLLAIVRKHKDMTGVGVSRFIEDAIVEKLLKTKGLSGEVRRKPENPRPPRPKKPAK